MTDDELREHVRRAVALSLEHVERGGIPFSGLVVHPRQGVIGEGVNRVAANHDPLAHAEVVAIQDACAKLRVASLHGCTLIASGEPCALCYMAALYSGITTIVYAVDRHGAAAAGFDYSGSYSIFALPPERWPMDVRAMPVENGDEPFERWLANNTYSRR
ncbi:nucleoside deaminase [Saccharothrix sp. HUAS TT1]|uniref:nucleoside deaminase n=1 Tax=unclassified Saccharothrix TaxID=2593673 RepID=UPI00345B6B13